MPDNEAKFYGKRSILTPTEQKFFNVLVQSVRDTYHISSQVRLESIIGVAKGSRYGARSKIDKKSVDFVLNDAVTGAIVLVIELDDWTHARQDRVDRDAFVDAALAQAGIKILHVKVQSDYGIEDLRQKIKYALHDSTAVSSEYEEFVQTAAVEHPTRTSRSRGGRYKKRQNGSSSESWVKNCVTSALAFIFVLYVFGAFAQQISEVQRNENTKTAVSPKTIQNGVESGSCAFGFKKTGQHCEQVPVPPHAKLAPSGTTWQCDAHYKKSGEKCVVEVPKHAHMNGDRWNCDAGYKVLDYTCIPQ